MNQSTPIKFTIDARLLEELGDRLVGNPSVALAELVKNSYDADATKVQIRVDKKSDKIIVADDGHGMDAGDFEKFWMRIGSTHKLTLKHSREFGRPYTGSKGVGRLSAQFLGRRLRIETVAKGSPGSMLVVDIDWDEAVKAKDLVEATAFLREEENNTGIDSGTRLTITGLKHEWASNDLKSLAKQVWALQPPFESELKKESFKVELTASDEASISEFKEQMQALNDIWVGKIEGSTSDGIVEVTIDFKDGQPLKHVFPLTSDAEWKKKNEAILKKAKFLIRIYKIEGRQKKGLKVKELQGYLNTWGGVHIYDSGFRLPYYGGEKNDWLNLEAEQSHRRSISALLPREFKESESMQNLPYNSRIFGHVEVDTKESGLSMAITRDRLVENQAHDQLRYMIRYALHLYAAEFTRRKGKRDLHEKEEEIKQLEAGAGEHVNEEGGVSPETIEEDSVLTVLDRHRESLPFEAFQEISQTYISKEAKEKNLEIAKEEKRRIELSMMASLATAGISAYSFLHEINKMLGDLETIKSRIAGLSSNPSLQTEMNALSEEISQWLVTARGLKGLFSPLGDVDNSRKTYPFKAKPLVTHLRKKMGRFLKGATIEIEIPDNVRLPDATYMEWHSILQNVLFNAYNAMLASEKRIIHIQYQLDNGGGRLCIQDTGVGVDLERSEELFEPFVRRLVIPEELKELGYGGSGMGLPIVRMIANRIGCQVRFEEPSDGYSTNFAISWRGKE